MSIYPWAPSVLWAQLIGTRYGWRYVGLLAGVWAFVGVALTALFYFPPLRPNSQGLTRTETFKRVDYLGGLLSVAGLVLFIAGLQWGNYQVRARVREANRTCLLMPYPSTRGLRLTASCR